MPSVSQDNATDLMERAGITEKDFLPEEMEAYILADNPQDRVRVITSIMDRLGTEAQSAESVTDDRTFWGRRPLLEHIYRVADGCRVSPYAVLAGVLAQIAAAVSPDVTFMRKGSLNQFFAIPGESGTGKGQSQSVARQCVSIVRAGFPVTDAEYLPSGTGEGFTRLLLQEMVADDPEKPDDRHPGPYKSIIADIPEIDVLGGKLSQQGGKTLRATLCSLWTGERAGSTTSDESRRTNLADESYRFCLVTGVQPRNSDAILNADGAVTGLAQRFVWLPAISGSLCDFTCPRMYDIPKMEIELPAKLPSFANPGQAKVRIDVHAQIEQEIDAQAIAVQRGEITPGIDSHRLQQQLKVACVFAIADGRLEVNLDDWELAGHVMRVSDATRAACQAELKLEALEQIEEAAKREAHRHAQRKEATAQILQLGILSQFEKKGCDRILQSDIKSGLTRGVRGYAQEQIDEWCQSPCPPILKIEQPAGNGRTAIYLELTYDGRHLLSELRKTQI